MRPTGRFFCAVHSLHPVFRVRRASCPSPAAYLPASCFILRSTKRRAHLRRVSLIAVAPKALLPLPAARSPPRQSAPYPARRLCHTAFPGGPLSRRMLHIAPRKALHPLQALVLIRRAPPKQACFQTAPDSPPSSQIDGLQSKGRSQPRHRAVSGCRRPPRTNAPNKVRPPRTRAPVPSLFLSKSGKSLRALPPDLSEICHVQRAESTLPHI